MGLRPAFVLAVSRSCGRRAHDMGEVYLARDLALGRLAFAGQSVGVTQVADRIWLVTFMQYDLGYFDDETCRLEPIENPTCPCNRERASGRMKSCP